RSVPYSAEGERGCVQPLFGSVAIVGQYGHGRPLRGLRRSRSTERFLQIEATAAHALARQSRQRINVREDAIDDLLIIVVRVMGHQERAGSGDAGCGWRGAVI